MTEQELLAIATLRSLPPEQRAATAISQAKSQPFPILERPLPILHQVLFADS